MKRISFLVAFVFCCVVINAQDSTLKINEAYRKTAQKEAKKTAKELKKEGWTYSGAMSLEGSLTEYYMKSESFGGQCDTRFYTVNNVPSLRNGELQLLTTAQNEYAQENEAVLMGKVTDHSGTDETTLRNSIIKMSANLKGDVKKCFTLYKRNSNGSFDMCGYFLIDVISANKKINKIAKDLEMGNLIEEAAVEK